MNKTLDIGDTVKVVGYHLGDYLKEKNLPDLDMEETDHTGERGTVRQVFHDGYSVVLDGKDHELFFMPNEIEPREV